MKIFDKLSRDTTKNNRLIAEFMGMTQGRERWPNDWFDDKGTINGARNEHLLFHSSWDWLMPVIHKIPSLCDFKKPFDCPINGKRVELFHQVNLFCDIDEAYEAVVEFITWYNENKEK